MSLGRSIIVYFGFVLAVFVFLLAVFIGILFLSPEASLFGVTSVTAREVYTTYTAEQIPGIGDVLSHRNIIIESDFIDVEVRVRKANQQDAGSIQVWENSTGLSFNSVKRTHIEWAQVILPREHIDEVSGKAVVVGELWYKIKIIEPKGIVSRSTESYVFINMYATEDNSVNQQKFNFILDTGLSNVQFASDDDSIVFRNPLEVDTLEIKDARGEIYLPPAPVDTEPDSFYVNIGNVVVDTKSVYLKCESPVRNNVWINCGAGSFVFRDIDGSLHIQGGINEIEFHNIGGSVKVLGSYVSIAQKAEGVITGDVDYQVDSGLVTINQCRILYVRTANSLVNVSVLVAGLDFEATKLGSIDVASIKGDQAYAKTADGNIRLYKVWVDTYVESRFGLIQVDFDADIRIGIDHEPSLVVRGFDGAISCRYIVGEVDIFVSANGNANVVADFLQVKGGASRIVYEGSTNPNKNKGEISVTFIDSISYCILNIERMASAHNYTDPTMLSQSWAVQETIAPGASLVNGAWYHVNYARRLGDSTGNLKISTSNRFSLYSRVAWIQ